MSNVRVGGEFGARASVTAAEDEPVVFSVHGVTDEVAARVLLGDVQVGVGRRDAKSEGSGAIDVTVPKGFVANTMEEQLVHVELGRAPVQHGRSGAEVSLQWTNVAEVTVVPAKAHAASRLVAVAPLVIAGSVIVEALSTWAQTSRGRLALDGLTVLLSCAPLAYAERNARREKPRWTRARLLSLATVAVVMPLAWSGVAVDNQSRVAQQVDGVTIPPGLSRWLPFELEQKRDAIARSGLALEPMTVQRSCVLPSRARPWSASLVPGLRVYRREEFRAVERGALARLGQSNETLCGQRSNNERDCCLRMQGATPNEATPSGATASESAPNATFVVRNAHRNPTPTAPAREVHVRWRPDEVPLSTAGLGEGSLRALAWHGLSMRGARRDLGDVEMRWSPGTAVRELELDGFDSTAPRRVEFALDEGVTVTADCSPTATTVHVVRERTGSLQSFALDGRRWQMNGDQPAAVCVDSDTRAVSLTFAERVPGRPETPAWRALGAWPMPVSTRTVRVFATQGRREIFLGTAHCPALSTRHYSVRPVHLQALGSVNEIHHHPAGARSALRWQSAPDAPSEWAFLCVATAPGEVPSSEPALGAGIDEFTGAADFRVLPRDPAPGTAIAPPAFHATLDVARERWSLSRSDAPLPTLAHCCRLNGTGELRTCPADGRQWRMSRTDEVSPQDCSGVYRLEVVYWWYRRYYGDQDINRVDLYNTPKPPRLVRPSPRYLPRY